MSKTLIASANFLASLGITDSEAFQEAFQDMATFTDYCAQIGYSWEIDEDNQIVLISPNGKAINTMIDAGQTKNYFRLTAVGEGEGTITLVIPATIDDTLLQTIEYSLDGRNFESVENEGTGHTFDFDVYQGDSVYFRATGNSWAISGSSCYFESSIDVDASGNVMSLLYGDDFEEETSFPERTDNNVGIFGELFSSLGARLRRVNNLLLPATTLSEYCYMRMFRNCSAITATPTLPATTLAASCYEDMFKGCASITAFPALPATTMAEACYSHMFQECSSVVVPPVLNSVSLAERCYAGMFSGCSAMTSAPALPATTLADGCYANMFTSCTALLSAPALPATTLAEECYSDMFSHCDTLQAPPALNATTLATGCYEQMFWDCTALRSAPTLNSTTLAARCYYGMFHHCTSLITAPELPATVLADNCYQSMFKDCSSLVNVSTLPAETLTVAAYSDMFKGCVSLSALTMNATTLASLSLQDWLGGIQTNGVLTVNRNSTLTDIEYNLPATWTIAGRPTATPVITTTPGDASYSISASGSGTVFFYADGVQVSNPYVVTRTNADQTITFTATAQEAGHVISDTATSVVVIPALPVTATPTIITSSGDAAYTVTATGDGTVLLYADGSRVNNPCTVTRTNASQTIVFTATAQETNKQISATATETVVVPALPMSTAPTITATERTTDYLIEVTAGQDAVIEVTKDGTLQNNPFTVSRENSDVQIEVVATATEPNHQPTTVTQTITILALPVTATPTISAVEGSTDVVVTASGNGTVNLYAEGVQVSNPYNVAKTATAQTITFTATAQEVGKQISAVATEVVNVPALPVTAAPTINVTQGTSSTTVEATGAGTVTLYADGAVVANPYTVNFGNVAQTIVFTATAQETGKQVSPTTSETVVVPALPVTATPTISAVEGATDVVVTASGNGTVNLYAEGVQVSNPHTVNKTASAQTITFTATAQEVGKQISATATEVVNVPAVLLDYMRLEILNEPNNDGNVTISIPSRVDRYYATSMSYSKDGSNWTDTTINSTDQTITIPVTAGDTVYLKGVANKWGSLGLTGQPLGTTIRSTVKHNVAGNSMSLFYGDNFTGQTTFPSYESGQFAGLMNNNSGLVDASQLELPATTLRDKCYASMFSGCTSLTTAPAIPATATREDCCLSMFSGCTSLTTLPNNMLPATTLANNCYQSMFQSCTSLTSAPVLPATSLGNYCYTSMFSDCTSLTSAPALPATTLKQHCYADMFWQCTSLTSAPALPATTLGNYCYQSMFYGCRALTSAPSLPATALADYCYTGMFKGCTSLTTLPNNMLPATTLASNCYSSMFNGCTSLTSAPVLPATTLANSCYSGMFQGCRALTTLPNNMLPATTLTSGCYQSMFQACTSLTTVPSLPATTLANSCYGGMFNQCSRLTAVSMPNLISYDATAAPNAFGGSWLQSVGNNGTLTVNENTTVDDSVYDLQSNWSIVPARTAAPTISAVENTNDVTITATGAGTVTLYDNGTAVNNPYVVAKTSTAQTLTMTATAKDTGLRISNTTTESVEVPAVELPTYPGSIQCQLDDSTGEVTIDYAPVDGEYPESASIWVNDEGVAGSAQLPYTYQLPQPGTYFIYANLYGTGYEDTYAEYGRIEWTHQYEGSITIDDSDVENGNLTFDYVPVDGEYPESVDIAANGEGVAGSAQLPYTYQLPAPGQYEFLFWLMGEGYQETEMGAQYEWAGPNA